MSNSITGVCFDNSNFTNAVFGANTQLTGATFRGATLEGLTARGIVAQGVDFSDAKMSGANFEQADLRNSRFNGNLSDVSFKGANLAGAIFEPGTLVNVETLIEATLDGAVIAGVNLQLEGGGTVHVSPSIQAALNAKYEELAINGEIQEGEYLAAVDMLIEEMQMQNENPAMAEALKAAKAERLGEDLLMAMEGREGAAQEAYQMPDLASGITELDQQNAALNTDDVIQLEEGDFELGQCAAPQVGAEQQAQQGVQR